MSEWKRTNLKKTVSRYQVSQCPSCGCWGSEVVVLDEIEIEEKRVLDG